MAFTATDGSGANSFQGFRAFVSRKPPSYNNLYWVRFRGRPNVLVDSYFNDFFSGNNSDSAGFSYGGPGSDNSRLLTYYANDVTIPSRQLTTGDARTVGSLYRYPTGTTFSEISINFTLSRDLTTRMFFERWMNYITQDSGNQTAWYKDAVCPFMDIIKYERGGSNPTKGNVSVVSASADQNTRNTVKWNQVTGAWVLTNAFPFNISNIQLNNGPASTVNMEVSFYYERYRFYQPKATGPSVIDNLGPTTASASAAAVQSFPGAVSINNTTTTATSVVSAGQNGIKP